MPDVKGFFGGGMVRLFDGDTGDLRPTDEVIEIIKSRMAQPNDATASGLIVTERPKYLIRVDFGPQTTTHEAAIGIVGFWQFPRQPKLDMIEQIYVCEAPGCKGILPKEAKVGETWICTECKRAWNQRDLGSGMFAFKKSMDDWGGILSRLHDRFGGLCEILTMRRRVSVQKATSKVLAGEKNADMDYMLSHGSSPMTGVEAGYFTMKSLHKDTAAGSSVASRIAAFLKGG